MAIKDHVIERQGKQFILYDGLLQEAHSQGLKRIQTTLIQVPHESNGNIAIVGAEVETGKGVFTGIGDASPSNVNRMIVPHIIRMAETRAKARALRDATNIAMVVFEELSDIAEADGTQTRTRTGSTTQAQPAQPEESITDQNVKLIMAIAEKENKTPPVVATRMRTELGITTIGEETPEQLQQMNGWLKNRLKIVSA